MKNLDLRASLISILLKFFKSIVSVISAYYVINVIGFKETRAVGWFYN